MSVAVMLTAWHGILPPENGWTTLVGGIVAMLGAVGYGIRGRDTKRGAEVLLQRADDVIARSAARHIGISSLMLVNLALHCLHIPYRLGGEARFDRWPTELDCSELIQFICRILRIAPTMPDYTVAQWEHCKRYGTICDIDDALWTPGALVWRFSSNPGGKRPKHRHVALTLGDGKTVIEATHRAGRVVISSDSDGWTHAARIPGVAYA